MMPDESFTTVPPFVDAAWLRGREDNVLLADLRWSMDGSEGVATYLEGHLPGAVYIDLDEVAAAPPSIEEGRHPLPTPEVFAAALGERGVGEDGVVVAYDQGPGAIAARLVWMLRVLGQPAAVLEGGLAGWDGELETGAVDLPSVSRPAKVWPPQRLADADLTAQLAQRPDAVVLDARDPARYRGDHEPIDARPGHIPGAANRPFMDNLAEDGRLRSDAELRADFAAVGALGASEVVAYCGSGVTACHDLLVLEKLGVSGRLFPGSWSAWAADPERDAATGPGESPSGGADAGQ